MRISILICIFLVAGCATNKKFQETLVDLAGENANECGFVEYRSNTNSGFICAKSSIDSSEPFWLGIQKMGIDSEVWLGLAQSKGGLRYKVEYDSDVTGGGSSTKQPRINVMNCENWKIEKNGEILCNTP